MHLQHHQSDTNVTATAAAAPALFLVQQSRCSQHGATTLLTNLHWTASEQADHEVLQDVWDQLQRN